MHIELEIKGYIFKIYNKDYENPKIFTKDGKKANLDEHIKTIRHKFIAKIKLMGGENALKNVPDRRSIQK